MSSSDRAASAVAATEAVPIESASVSLTDVHGPEPGVWTQRLVPIAVASALFMEFVDSTALSTALPTLARSFHSDPLHLKLALTSYLLTLAVFAPASGWVADRFGAKKVFLSAMVVFLTGSVCCGLSHSLTQLVISRLVQGTGGAMMTPVGRLIVVNSAPRDRFVAAMSWFTMPALIGPLVGPAVSGLILSVGTWPMIFFVNVPIGLLGMSAVVRFVPNIHQPHPGRFDVPGFFFSAIGITAIIVTAETFGVALAPPAVVAAMAALGVTSLALLAWRASKVERPILNLRLLAHPTYRASLMGGTLVRLGIGATPLLLPLLLQLGLGWSPAKSGLVTISQTLGALTFKPVAPGLIRKLGFRTVLLMSILGVCILTSAPGLFRAGTPVFVMVVCLGLAGFVRSAQFTSANALAYSDIPKEQVSQASTLSTVVQQVGMSLGVSFGALSLSLVRGASGHLTPDRFTFPFVMVGVTALLAAPIYWRLSPSAGASISGKRQGGG